MEKFGDYGWIGLLQICQGSEMMWFSTLKATYFGPYERPLTTVLPYN